MKSNIYVLKDPKHETYVSPGDNFNRNWMAYSQKKQTIQFAPIQMSDFKVGDIIIIYLDGDKPYGSYNLIDGVRKIFITGRLTNSNVNYLKDADYIIYINELQKRVVEGIYDIVRPSYTCPRFPLPSFDINPIKKDRIFVGGILSYDKKECIKTELLDINAKYDKSIDVIFHAGGSGVLYKKGCDDMTNWLNASPLNGNRIVNVEFHKQYYQVLLYNIATSRYVHLCREGLTKEMVDTAIIEKNKNVLNNPLGESSLLAIAHRYGCEVHSNNNVSFLPMHQNNIAEYYIKDFSSDILRILSELT